MVGISCDSQTNTFSFRVLVGKHQCYLDNMDMIVFHALFIQTTYHMLENHLLSTLVLPAFESFLYTKHRMFQHLEPIVVATHILVAEETHQVIASTSLGGGCMV